MWAKRIVRVLAGVYIVGGAAALIALQSIARFTRWLVNQPFLMRLDGVLSVALGTVLALREYREEEPPPPWWKELLSP
jgi:hypothetical protein